MNYEIAIRHLELETFESIVQSLGISSVFIENGNETMDTDYVLFTYTDGYGDVPAEVETFLISNSSHLKGVIVSGDQSYGEAYCLAGDKLTEHMMFHVYTK